MREAVDRLCRYLVTHQVLDRRPCCSFIAVPHAFLNDAQRVLNTSDISEAEPAKLAPC